TPSQLPVFSRHPCHPRHHRLPASPGVSPSAAAAALDALDAPSVGGPSAPNPSATGGSFAPLAESSRERALGSLACAPLTKSSSKTTSNGSPEPSADCPGSGVPPIPLFTGGDYLLTQPSDKRFGLRLTLRQRLTSSRKEVTAVTWTIAQVAQLSKVT